VDGQKKYARQHARHKSSATNTKRVKAWTPLIGSRALSRTNFRFWHRNVHDTRFLRSFNELSKETVPALT
jgi:hypothetical protein